MKAFSSLAKITGLVPAKPPYPSGTRLFFDQDEVPTGWTRDVSASLDDRMVRVVIGAPGEGGSWTISGLSGDLHNHELPDVISHTHGASVGTHSHTFYYDYPGVGGYTGGGYNIAYTIRTGSAWYSVTLGDSGLSPALTENSSFGISSNGTWRPLYRDVIIGVKD